MARIRILFLITYLHDVRAFSSSCRPTGGTKRGTPQLPNQIPALLIHPEAT